MIDGDGWSKANKSRMNLIKAIIQQDFPNIAIVNINYRIEDAATSPCPIRIENITLIITHFEEQKERYGISNDFSRIDLSARAHLSLILELCC